MTYINRIKRALPAMAAAALALLTTTSCERRELYVYQDFFKQVILEIDWRSYDRDKTKYPHTPDPDGMTVWFYPTNGQKADHYTTAQVTRYETYLSQGDYEALVIDYSPEEYGKQEFIGMDYANTAKVQSLPAAYQSVSYAPLYNDECYGGSVPMLRKEAATGFWTVFYQPELMATDTTMMHIISGKYDHYIPYDERDSYQQTLIEQVFQMTPLRLPWRMRVRIPIKGIYYLYETKATIAGLADGVFLAKNETSDDPCLIEADDWEVYVTGDNVGYIAKTFDTWGLRNALWASYQPIVKDHPYTIEAAKNEVRVNVAIKLRDRQTVKYFHFDVGDNIKVFGSEYALSVDLRDVLVGDEIPELPYVDGVNGMQFGGVVIPWQDGAKAEVQF